MNLLIDCGNSRVKWALARGRQIGERGQIAHVGQEAQAVATVAVHATGEVRQVYIASVASPVFGQQLLAALRLDRQIKVNLIGTKSDSHGLRIAYREPQALGVDRWLSMIAARSLRSAPVCVVGAGTAVTFDAIDVSGKHLGGLILAGPKLAADALAQNTDRIDQTRAADVMPSGLAILGRTTQDAVAHGSFLAIAAAIDRAVATVAAELKKDPAVLLTGGLAHTLLPWLETRVTIHEDLVLEGLILVAEQDE
jgi:type III pantothenate kinase